MSELTLYEVRDTDDVGIQPDDPWDFASEIKARDPEEAAEKFAESFDQGGDYYLSKNENNEIEVEVRVASDHAQTQRFRCSAQHHTTYWAEAVEAAEPTS